MGHFQELAIRATGVPKPDRRTSIGEAKMHASGSA